MLKITIVFVLLLFVSTINAQNVSPQSMSEFIVDESEKSISQAWYVPNNSVGVVGKYHKMEIGFRLDKKTEKEIEKFMTNKGEGINPFNPEEIDVSIKLAAPNGELINTHGFYYLPYYNNPFSDKWVQDTTSFKWRLRFAPNQIGEWKAEIVVTTKGSAISKGAFTFTCKASNHKGVLMTSHAGTNADRYLYLSETGETFIPMGHNITTRGKDITPSKNELHKKWIKELGINGGNFFRMEMPAGGALPDWPIHNNYSEKLGKMYGYDEVVDIADALEMYFIMFRHHIEVGKQASWGVNWDCWANNPYKKAFDLGTSEAYFKSKEIIRWQKNALRYIMARWGYSPSFAFYGYSEVDLWIRETGLDESESLELFADWFIEMKSYINSELHFASNKFICSFRSSRPVSDLKHPKPASRILDECDVVSLHTYSYRKNDNFKRFNYVSSFLKEWENRKPVLLEETGIEANQGIFCCTSINFHNTIWASSFSGTMGAGMHWNWDRGIHSKGYYTEYRNLQVFFKNEDFRETSYTSQSWKNDNLKSLKNATLENYALVSWDKKKVLGWVHNSTYYWRNLSEVNSCIAELVDSNGVLLSPCPNEDKSPALGTNVHGYTYDNKEFKGKYTDKEGAITVQSNFVVKGLKGNGNRTYNPWAKKHWYKISYYSTHGKVSTKPIFTEVLSTNSAGKLKPKAPVLDEKNPDYSYKIEYIGFQNRKKAKY